MPGCGRETREAGGELAWGPGGLVRGGQGSQLVQPAVLGSESLGGLEAEHSSSSEEVPVGGAGGGVMRPHSGVAAVGDTEPGGAALGRTPHPELGTRGWRGLRLRWDIGGCAQCQTLGNLRCLWHIPNGVPAVVG